MFAPVPQSALCLMDDDTCQPSAELSLLPEGLQGAKGLHVGILHDLFGFPVAAEDAPGGAKQPPVVAAHDLLKGSPACRAGKDDKLMLACPRQVRSRRLSAQRPHGVPHPLVHEMPQSPKKF